jgi:hypothetical protein
MAGAQIHVTAKPVLVPPADPPEGEAIRHARELDRPENAVLADQFPDHFDGFSIGSNDMTQLTLGLEGTPI